MLDLVSFPHLGRPKPAHVPFPTIVGVLRLPITAFLNFEGADLPRTGTSTVVPVVSLPRLDNNYLGR